MNTLRTSEQIRGPWSLETSRRFWENFSPAALAAQTGDGALRTTFRVEADWSSVRAVVRQDGSTASIEVTGDGDLDAAAAQVRRFLTLDVDATGWPAVGDRDPVIGRLQQQAPGLRPCGFHSPYEAAAWAVLSQRIGIRQAAALRSRIIETYGDDGAFPAPERLRGLDLDLPGRKAEYLHAVAESALEGRLDTLALRAVAPELAVADVRQIKGIGPFSAELIVLRGVNVPDALPHEEGRLAEIVRQTYGDRPIDQVGEVWRPFRMWAAFHLRALSEIPSTFPASPPAGARRPLEGS